MPPTPESPASKLRALTAQYQASKADHELIRDEWQRTIVRAVDDWQMTVQAVANLAGVSVARIQAIIARQYTLQRENPGEAEPIPLIPAA